MKPEKQISLLNIISIGIGGMVGGGIFAVLGLAVSLAKGGTPLAFLFAGIIAFLTAYSYAKLSEKCPDKGGTVAFVHNYFNGNVFSSGINNLLWLSYIVMLALYSSAFGSYAAELFPLSGSKIWDIHIFQTAILIIALLINYLSIWFVSQVESVSVFIKLVILIAFVALGFYGFHLHPDNLQQLSPKHWENPFNLLVGGMVIFVAYEGFELIANSVYDLKDREKNTIKAYFGSVVFVIILYVLIAIVTVGSLPFSKIYTAQDYVLAEAAKPMLGKAGFIIITITALISTFSAINSTVLGSGRVNYEISEDKELPHFFMKEFFGRPIGFVLTTLLSIILVNSFELHDISTAGSAGFLLIFAIVNYIAFKLSKTIKSKSFVHLLGCVLCFIAFISLLTQQLSQNPIGVFIVLGMIIFSFVSEWLYMKVKL